MRKTIYALYLVLFEIPNILMPLAGIRINNVISHTITNYERNQIIKMVRQRDEAIGMKIMPEQIQEKEQYIK